MAATLADTMTAVAVQAASANIYTSSTGDAALWEDRSYPGSCSAVAVDASGKYMAAARSSGLIWYSQDKGATWTAIANSGTRNWVSISRRDDLNPLQECKGADGRRTAMCAIWSQNSNVCHMVAEQQCVPYGRRTAMCARWSQNSNMCHAWLPLSPGGIHSGL
jgi:hypothetical protein